MKTAKDVMDQSYIEARSKLIDVAAILDRYDRAAGGGGGNGKAGEEKRMAALRAVIGILNEPGKRADRAEQVLKHLSLPFEEVK